MLLLKTFVFKTSWKSNLSYLNVYSTSISLTISDIDRNGWEIRQRRGSEHSDSETRNLSNGQAGSNPGSLQAQGDVWRHHPQRPLVQQHALQVSGFPAKIIEAWYKTISFNCALLWYNWQNYCQINYYGCFIEFLFQNIIFDILYRFSMHLKCSPRTWNR